MFEWSVLEWIACLLSHLAGRGWPPPPPLPPPPRPLIQKTTMGLSVATTAI